jgi:hypothetical protein
LAPGPYAMKDGPQERSKIATAQPVLPFFSRRLDAEIFLQLRVGRCKTSRD